MTIRELINHLEYLAVKVCPAAEATEVYYVGDYGANMELQEGSVIYKEGYDRVEIG